jgi:hypothetical protein
VIKIIKLNLILRWLLLHDISVFFIAKIIDDTTRSGDEK